MSGIEGLTKLINENLLDICHAGDHCGLFWTYKSTPSDAGRGKTLYEVETKYFGDLLPGDKDQTLYWSYTATQPHLKDPPSLARERS